MSSLDLVEHCSICRTSPDDCQDQRRMNMKCNQIIHAQSNDRNGTSASTHTICSSSSSSEQTWITLSAVIRRILFFFCFFRSASRCICFISNTNKVLFISAVMQCSNESGHLLICIIWYHIHYFRPLCADSGLSTVDLRDSEVVPLSSDICFDREYVNVLWSECVRIHVGRFLNRQIGRIHVSVHALNFILRSTKKNVQKRTKFRFQTIIIGRKRRAGNFMRGNPNKCAER